MVYELVHSYGEVLLLHTEFEHGGRSVGITGAEDCVREIRLVR